MSDQKYQLILTGELLEGFELEDVVNNLGQILKFSVDQRRAMLQGCETEIRKVLDHEKAEYLRKKFLDRGVQCYIQPLAPEEDPKPSEPDVEAPHSGLAQAEGLSLDLDEPDEKPAEQPDDGGLELVPMEEEKAAEPAEDGTVILDLSASAEPAAKTEPVPEAVDRQQEEAKREDSDKKSKPDPDSEMNKGTFIEQPSVAASKSVEKKRPAVNRSLLMVAGLLLIAAVAWFVFPVFTDSADVPPQVQTQSAEPVDPQLALTRKRINNIFRLVRVWMIQFGSGFNPSQVTLERLAQDLGLTTEQMNDGWGQLFRYAHNDQEYSVTSAGPDGQFRTPDDIVMQGSVAPNK